MHKPPSTPHSVRRDDPPQRRGVHPIQSVIRHRWIALALLAAVALIAIPVLASLQSPVFFAESVFMVSPVTKNPGEDREFALPRYGEFVNQQLLLVVREDVCLDALDRLGEARSAWRRDGESMRDAAVRLSRALQVSRIPETSYVAVGLEASREEGLVVVVNAVMEAYLDRAKGQTLYGLDARTEILKRRVSELQDEIRAKTDQLSRWSKELGVPTMESAMLSPMIDEMERSQRDAKARRVAAEARLGGVEARYQVLKEANTADRTVLVPDAELLQVRTVLLARKSELKAKLFGLTPEHEGRKAIESEIGEIDAELQREEKAALDRQIRLAASKLEEARANGLVLAQAELAEAKRYEQVVGQELAELKEKVFRLYPESQGLQQEVDRLRRQLGIVQERLDAMRLETHAPGFVQLAMPASMTEVPPGRRTLKGIVLLAGLAAFLVVMVPVTLDLIRDRVRSDSDVEGAVISIPLWKGNRDNEPAAGDQLRRLALALDRERRLHNRASFVFTSVLPGAGTSQIVLDLARELREVGVSVLAIEANPMRPDPRFAGAPGRPGLALGLDRGARIADLIIPSDGDLPERISIGSPEGRTNLPGLEKLDALLAQATERYAAVLIDAPPILQSADAEFLASRAQAVVLIVEAERTPVASLNRATRILRQAGANLVLTVMNRVRMWRDQGHKSAIAFLQSP